VESEYERISVRQDVVEPPQKASIAATITIIERGGVGYAATGDLTRVGLEEAARRATE
jgi:hypothetical protein